MKRNNGINNGGTLPAEILLTIFRAICDTESDIAQYSVPRFPNDSDVYLNRYRHPAKVLRRVCRRWCQLVDLPSTYFLRVTTAYLVSEPPQMQDLTSYREHIKSSRSMLSLGFRFGISMDDLDEDMKPEDLPPTIVEPVLRFVEEMRSAITLQKRLISLRAWISEECILAILREVLQSLDRSAPLADIGIEEGRGIPDEYSGYILPEALGIPKAKVGPEVFHLGRLESVRQLRVLNPWCNARIILPPALTDLSLEFQLTDLPSILASCGGCLKMVELFITNNLSDEEEERFYMLPSIILPTVKVISIHADSRTAQIAIKKITCPNLEEIMFGRSPDGVWESPEVKDMWKIEKVAMPNLKRIQVPYVAFLAFCDLSSVIDFPLLDQFAIAAWNSLSTDIVNIVPGLQFKALTCEETSYSWLAALAGILDVQMVEEFLITLPNRGVFDLNFDGREFSFILPNLKNLSISGENLSIISKLLSKMEIGEQLETLELIHLVDQNTPSPESLHRLYPELAKSLIGKLSEWEKFVSRGMRGFSRVKTIITAPPPRTLQSTRFLQNLFELCQKAETFVIKDLTIDLLEQLPYLDEIQSKGSGSSEHEDAAIGPHLQHLIFEAASPSEFGYRSLLSLKPKLEETFTSFAAARVAAGAVEMKYFTVRLVNPLETSEAVELPMDRGAVLRLEVVKKPTRAAVHRTISV
jgi:hypothetical protein